MKSQPIIFTDLDGTLLEHQTYSFTAAVPALEFIKSKGIPLVFCSSKTRAEIECWRERLKNTHPFISENGGGIFIPLSYFLDDDPAIVWPRTKKADRHYILALGMPYQRLREVLDELRKGGFEVKGFGDMDAAEVAQITGLNLKDAALAKQRDFDESFVFTGEQSDLSRLFASIEKKGLRYTVGGRFYHLMGDNDKGVAMDILKELYERKFGETVTIALGDSPNDLPMLERADYPILVQNHKGEHDRRIALPNLIKADGIGPQGWGKAVLNLIHDLFTP